MTNETMNRPASSKQLGYIRQLRAKTGLGGEPMPKGLTSVQASQMIGDLLSQQQTEPFVAASDLHHNRLNHSRLGLAMKECFRLWTGQGRDIWDSRRDGFVRNVVATYHLFTEIEERLKPEKREVTTGRREPGIGQGRGWPAPGHGPSLPSGDDACYRQSPP